MHPRYLCLMGVVSVGFALSPLAGCRPDLELPAGALIRCATNADCPGGMICRTATWQCSPLTDDLEPPVLEDPWVDSEVVSRGGEVRASLYVTEELPYAPRVWLSGTAVRREMSLDPSLSGEGYYEYVYVVGADDPEGNYEVSADLVDMVGNLAAGVHIGSVLFDFTPPGYLDFSAGLRLSPAEGMNPLPEVDTRFLTWGTTVTVWFTLTEPSTDVALRAIGEGFELEFEDVSESIDGMGFLLQATLTPDPAAPARDEILVFEVRATDAAGNRSEPVRIDDLVLLLDTEPPDAPVQSGEASAPLLTYRRSPGATAGSEARFSVHAPPDTFTGGDTLIVYDGRSPLSANELARGRVDPDGGIALDLRRADHPEVFVLVVDGAGNVSDDLPDDNRQPGLFGDVQASRVRQVEYVVPSPQLAGSRQGASQVTSTGRLLASLAQDRGSLTVPAEAPTCLAGIEGTATHTLTRAGEALWIPHPASAWPSPRRASAAAWDSRRGKLVLFGGVDANSAPLRDTWEFDPSTGIWSEREPTGALPSARSGHAMAFDERRGRVLLFGGFDALVDDEDAAVWEWDGDAGSWLRRAPSGEGPHFRSGHALFYDAERGRLLLFGGDRRFPEETRYSGETWSWEPFSGRWTLVTGSGPSPRTGAALARAPSGGWLLVGGYGEAAGIRALLGDTWLFDAASDTWTALPQAGALPVRRDAMAALVDATQGSGPTVLLFGGAADGGAVRTDAWLFDGAHWSPLPDGAAPSRAGSLFVPAEESKSALLFGGLTAVSPSSTTDDLLRYDLSFTRLGPGAERPQARAWAGLAVDAARKVALLFGGERAGAPLGDGWTLDAGGVWARLPETDAPEARSGTAIAWDEQRRQMVLFGGRGAAGLLADTWLWNGAWTRLVLAQPPPARERAAMAWDPARKRVVLFGGRGAAGWLADVWEWNGTAWTERPAAGAWPEPREAAGLAADADRGKLVLFGGLRHEGDVSLLDADVWEWDGLAGTFSRRGPGPTSDSAQTALGRTGASLAWDARRHKVLLFGGRQNAPLGDLWERDGTSGAWLERTPTGGSPRARLGQAAAWDPLRGRWLLFGGSDGRVELDDLWELDAGATGRPALLWSAPFPSVDTLPMEMLGATVRATIGGRSASGTGAALLLWDTAAGRWRSLGENDAPTWPAGLVGADGVELAAADLSGALPQAGRTLELAVVPKGATGADAAPAEVGADYLEIELRYLLPRGAP